MKNTISKFKEKTLSNKWLILLGIVFSSLIFLKPTLFDMDSYYFAGIACGKIAFRPLTDSTLSGIIFERIPCNLLVFKAVLVSIFLVCLLIIKRIGQQIDSNYSQWLPFIMGGGLTFYSYFSKMEDDTFGLPFIFGSLYYLVKYSKSKKIEDFAVALVICLAGFTVWKGIALWGLIVLSAGAVSWILSAGILWSLREILIPRYYPIVSEELPLAGILSTGLVAIGALFLPPIFFPAVSFAFMLAMIKLKYALFFGILSSLGLYYYLVNHKFFEVDEKKVFGYKKSSAFIAILLLFNFSGIIGVYGSPPTIETINLVENFSNHAKDMNMVFVYNDWEYGHLIAYNGLTPSNQYGPPTPSFNGIDGLILTRQKLDCPVFDSYQEVYSYDCTILKYKEEQKQRLCP